MLEKERQAERTIHHGRHSFVSHALAAGRTLAEGRDAAGQADPSTTELYDRRGYDPEESASFFANC